MYRIREYRSVGVCMILKVIFVYEDQSREMYIKYIMFIYVSKGFELKIKKFSK